jgi:hypothetical protein
MTTIIGYLDAWELTQLTEADLKIEAIRLNPTAFTKVETVWAVEHRNTALRAVSDRLISSGAINKGEDWAYSILDGVIKEAGED